MQCDESSRAEILKGVEELETKTYYEQEEERIFRTTALIF